MERLMSSQEMAQLLIKAANNLNTCGLNRDVGYYLLQILHSLSETTLPREDIVFLNEYCTRLRLWETQGENPIEVFDVISDVSQMTKRLMIAKERKTVLIENPDPDSCGEFL